MPLTEADRIRMLEELAEDKALKATQRLRALEELGRIEARRKDSVPVSEDERLQAPDPMGDVDELDAWRRRRRGAR